MRKESLAILVRVFIFLSNFGIVMLNVHYAGLEGQGIISLLNTGILLYATLSAFIGGGALVYLLPRLGASRLLSPSLFWMFASGILTAIILTVLDAPIILHALLLGLLQSSFMIHQMILLGQNRSAEYQYMILFQGVMSVSLTWSFYFFAAHPTYSHFIAALYGSFIATNVYGFILTRDSWKGISKPERTAWKSLWDYGKYTQAGNILHMTNQRGYLFVLEKSSPEGNLMAGIFSVLLYIGEGIWSVAKSLSAIQGAEIAQDEEHAEHRAITRRYLKVSLAASTLGIVFFLLLPSRWLAIFLDNKSDQVIEAFYYFIPGILLHTITIILAHYFSGKGYHRYNAVSSFFGLLTSVALAGIFIPRMGIHGAALSISISIAVQCLVQFILYRRVVKALGINPM